jgi:hypothetical protein
MRYGRALLAGLGWAGTLGCLALCVLILLSAYVAFDSGRPGVKPRKDGVLRLPSVPDAEVPRVPLARPPGRLARGGAGGAATSTATPRASTTPRATAPVETAPPAPAGGNPQPPAATPSPGGAAPAPASGRPLPPPSSPPTLGDTIRGVVGAVGTQVGQVSPPAGQVIGDAGDTLGDAVDAVTPPPPGR